MITLVIDHTFQRLVPPIIRSSEME